MKKCVIYYSMSGNVDRVARMIAEESGADLIRLVPKKAYPDKGLRKFYWGGKAALMAEYPELEDYDFKADDYDSLVIGTAVWASTFTPVIGSFIRDNREKIEDKKISAYVCYMGSGAQSALNKLKDALGIPAYAAELSLKDSEIPDCKKKIEDFCSKI